MKILLISTLFSPSIGGIETVSEILAREFSKAGHEVRVLTDTALKDQNLPYSLPYPFEILRKPGLLQIFKAFQWCDVSLHACVSMKYFLTSLLTRKPALVSHHTWYKGENLVSTLKGRAKLFMTKFANNIAVSTAIKESIPGKCKVIENPYDNTTFIHESGSLRIKDLVFLGRLVSDKGADILINAMNTLKLQGVFPTLSIIGDGPEYYNIETLINKYSLQDQICLLKEKSGKDLASILNQHKIMVVPSRWEEPYGIVALEGLACGLKLIVAETGGLPEASGEFGIKFKPGCYFDLAEKISNSLNSSESVSKEGIPKQIEEHLNRHSPDSIASLYLSEIKRICFH